MWLIRYSGWLLGCCYAVARVPGVVATHFCFICSYSSYIYIFYKITLIENLHFLQKLLHKKIINKQQATLN